MQDNMKLDHMASAANTPKRSGVKRVVAFPMRPLTDLLTRVMKKGILPALR